MKKIYHFIFTCILGVLGMQLQAQTNIAPQAVASASTCNTGACSTLNDLNYGSCGSQQMWISTGTPPSLTPGVEWMQFDWTQPMSFNAMTIHHAQTGTRFMAGATVQYWDVSTSAWVTFFTFANLPDQCINLVPFPSTLTVARFRLTSFTMSGSQLSNINFREIEIWDAPAPNIPKDPPSPNFQFTLGQDTLWEKSVSTIINTSTAADKSYWNITQYSSGSPNGPWTNYSTLPKDTLQCNTLGCFIDTANNNPNLAYNFPNRGYYKVALTTVNVNGNASIEKVVYVDTPRSKPSAFFFATRRQIGINDRIQFNNMSTNAPATIKWWAINNTCPTCPADSNKFYPSDAAFNPTFAPFIAGSYKICLAVTNSKGSDTLCNNDYMKVLPGYLMMHNEPGRVDTVGKNDQGYLYSDLRGPAGIPLSGQFEPTTILGSGFRIAPCADTIYLTLERLRLRPGSFSGAGDSIYVRLNGYNGTIVRRYGGANFASLKDTTKVYKHIGQQIFITYTPAVGTPPPMVNDSGFTIKWTSSPATYPTPAALFSCPDTLYSGYKVRFINESTGSNLFYSWDLNNDGIYGVDNPSMAVDSITVNPTITYTTLTPSTRKVCLRTANCKGSDVYCKTLPIYPITAPPITDFIVNRTFGFISDTFKFIDKTQNGALAWKWRFEPNNVTYLAGTDSTSQFPVVSLNAAQYYNITLITSNTQGSSQITKNQLVYAIDYGSPNSAFPATLDATDFGISRVVINGADKILDTITNLKSPTYTGLFSELKTTVYRGGTYSIDVYRQTANDPMTLKIWADFNRDADYTDENELVFFEDKVKKVKSSTTITIPANAAIGTSRILIGACNEISTISSTTSNIGVYEDYGMVIGNDTKKPVITLKGSMNAVTEINHNFVDSGATATDNIQGDITNKIVTINGVNTLQLGFYTIKYYVTDMYGNTSDTLVRSVQVVLNSRGPSLSLYGNDTVQVEVHNDFVEPGYLALSHLGDTLTAQVQRSGMLNEDLLGTYVLTYTIHDAFGLNASQKRVVKVVDTQSPIIASYSGNDTVIHQIGTVFDDNKYIQVTDNYWAELMLYRNGELNTNKSGIYTLKYTSTDGSGNMANEYTFYVAVTNTVKPTINLVGSAVMIVPVYGSFNDLGVVAKDYKGDLLPYTSDLNEVLRMDTISDATVTYTATDEFGISNSVQRVIRVKDLESPVIEMLGGNPISLPLCNAYNDPGIKVSDNFNTSVFTTTSKQDGNGIQITIDSSKVNICGGGYYYTVYINATDAAGNKAEEKKRVVYVLTTGINDVVANDALGIYPNPATKECTINISGTEPGSMMAIDMLGKQFALEFVKIGNQYKLDITGLNTGTYLIRVTNKDGSMLTGKLNVNN